MKNTPNEHGQFLFNGIDRIDSLKGYILENVVTCCYQCNYAKSDLDIEEFKNLVIMIYKNLKLGV